MSGNTEQQNTIDIQKTYAEGKAAVIRCRDCKYWEAFSPELGECVFFNMTFPRDDGFCWWAVRR